MHSMSGFARSGRVHRAAAADVHPLVLGLRPVAPLGGTTSAMTIFSVSSRRASMSTSRGVPM